ncbi:MAG: radical SAM protein [Clostridia bacterium]|nr:radical SAM protein [Clostridia bacterium]
MIKMKGYIHSFESLAAVDGDGLRCAVFMSGCPLRCIYCHNPDTWHKSDNETDSESLVKKISRYKTYFGKDGGVTFSGGEPLLQSEFIKETIPLLKEQEIGYIIDTSGICDLTPNVCEVLKNSQSVLLDLKFWDNESYLRYTGGNLKKVLDTLSYLDSICKKTVIRTVIVPGINDREEILDKYLELVSDFSCISKYELLAFHTMGFFKYEKLGVVNPLHDKTALSHEKLVELQRFVNVKRKNG